MNDMYEMYEWVNLTPHSITVAGRTYQSRGFARVGEVASEQTQFAGLPVVVVKAGEVTGLPAPQPGVLFIVSRLTAQGLVGSGRHDIFFPHGEIRDSDGRIVGVHQLARLP
jgi:hypothetical protein